MAGGPEHGDGALCLLERRHYRRAETNFNMDVDLTAIPEDPGGHELARPATTPRVDAWMATHWSNWRLEVLRALDKGNLVIDAAERGRRRRHRVLRVRGEPHGAAWARSPSDRT